MIALYRHLAAIFVSSSTEKLTHTVKPFKAQCSKLIRLAALPRSVSPIANNEVDLMTTQLKEFDASDYLTDQQTIQAYLDEAASTGEPEIIADALAAIAKAKGMDNTLQPPNDPSLSSLISLANVLGVSIKLGINGE